MDKIDMKKESQRRILLEEKEYLEKKRVEKDSLKKHLEEKYIHILKHYLTPTCGPSSVTTRAPYLTSGPWALAK